MELTKTAKLQIYASEEEKALLLDSMRAYSDVCNYISNYIYTTKDLSQVSVQKHTYEKCRSEYGLPSQMACNVVRTVIGSYKTNKTNGNGWVECKYDAPQMTLSWNRDYSLTTGELLGNKLPSFLLQLPLHLAYMVSIGQMSYTISTGVKFGLFHPYLMPFYLLCC